MVGNLFDSFFRQTNLIYSLWTLKIYLLKKKINYNMNYNKKNRILKKVIFIIKYILHIYILILNKNNFDIMIYI